MDAKTFGAFIAGRRRIKNLTQADLAAKLNVTDKAVSRWERGVGFPDIGTIMPLAAALETSVLELMKTENENDYGLIYWPYRAYRVWVTGDVMAKMPLPMWEHVHNGGDLYLIEKNLDKGKGVIATSKKTGAPQMVVDMSSIISKINGSPYNEEDFPEVFGEHIRNGGALYTIGFPKDGKILVSTSKEPGGVTAMMSYEVDETYEGSSFAEISFILEQYIHIIKDMDKPERDRVRACHEMSSLLGYCITLPELDDLTVVYRDRKEDNILGYNPTVVCNFTDMLRSRYPSE